MNTYYMKNPDGSLTELVEPRKYEPTERYPTADEALAATIELLKVAKTHLAIHNSGHMGDKLRHDIQDLLVLVGHTPPELR